MAFDREPASTKTDLQRSSPTFVQKREIFERRTRKSKALKVMYFLSRPIGVVFGLSSLFYHQFQGKNVGTTKQTKNAQKHFAVCYGILPIRA